MTAGTKPPHSFAIVLWIIAPVLLVTEIPILTLAWTQMQGAMAGGHTLFDPVRFAYTSVRYVLGTLVPIAAFGFVIDLLDHLRWQGTPPDERDALRDRYLVRRWGRLADRWRRSRVP